MKSSAKTVDEYIKHLPEDRQEPIRVLRRLILQNLPEGYTESMTWGMPGYEVPLSRFPNTYNKKPLMYAAIASQKNNYALYLTVPYMNNNALSDFKQKYQASGKKLDMGKSCIRFKKLEDLPLEVIKEQIASISVDEFIDIYEKTHT